MGHSLGAHRSTAALIIAQKYKKEGRVKELFSTSFARPNGFFGIPRTLYKMGASNLLQDAFREADLTSVLQQTRVYSHNYDIVPRIGYIKGPSLGALHILPTPKHDDYKPGLGKDAITLHHRMSGIAENMASIFAKRHIGTDTDESDSKTNADTSLSLRSVSTGSNQVHDELEDEDAEMLKRVEQSRQENLNMQAAIRNSVVPGKREADK